LLKTTAGKQMEGEENTTPEVEETTEEEKTEE